MSTYATTPLRLVVRGTVFPVPSVVDVLRTYNELKQMARTACDEGTLDEFLRGLDGEPSAKVETPRFGEFSEEWLA